MELEPKKPKQKKNLLEEWENEGVPCYYARFQQPVPPSVNKEPVSEFCIRAKQLKYLVDRLTYTTHGLIWRSGGEIDLTPLPNVMYVRFIHPNGPTPH